jgi:hypothetical protein
LYGSFSRTLVNIADLFVQLQHPHRNVIFISAGVHSLRLLDGDLGRQIEPGLIGGLAGGDQAYWLRIGRDRWLCHIRRKELLPTNVPFGRPPEGPSGAPQDPQGSAPLDDNLGDQGILRTSPLIAVPPIC